MSMTLTTMFGGSPDVRVLEFFATHPDLDYNISDIARFAGVSRPTAYRIVERLLDQGVLTRTRRVGTSWLFALDTESPLVESLIEFEVKLTEVPRRAGNARPRREVAR